MVMEFVYRKLFWSFYEKLLIYLLSEGVCLTKIHLKIWSRGRSRENLTRILIDFHEITKIIYGRQNQRLF